MSIQQAIELALQHHQSGRLAEAETIYRQILSVEPGNAITLHLLGLLAHQVGRNDVAVDLIRRAIAQAPDVAAFHSNLGEALRSLGQLGEAIAECRRAIALEPGMPEAHLNLGNALKDHGQPDEAIAAYRRAIALRPTYPEAHGNLGIALIENGRLDEAIAACRQAVALRPGYAEAHNNLGSALRDKGQLEEAIATCRHAITLHPQLPEAHATLGTALRADGRIDEATAAFHRALQLKPDYAEAHNNLGIALRDQGRLDEAIGAIHRAIQAKPDYAEAHCNLALLLNAQGKSDLALGFVRQSLKIRETAPAKRAFVHCVEDLQWAHDDSEVRTAMVRALTEPWGRPRDLARSAASLVKLDPGIAQSVASAAAASSRPARAMDLFGPDCLAALGADPLLRALLHSAPICDIELERLLTLARRALLEAAVETTDVLECGGDSLNFYSALARQCYVTEYVFWHTEEEIKKAGALRDLLAARLAENGKVPALWLVAVAAYFPLSSLPLASQLLDHPWPEAVTDVLVQQVREPMEERQERSSIPKLTDIEDEVSLLVQNQYEENPFPRWVKAEPAGNPRSLAEYFCDKFPAVPFQRPVGNSRIDILIAGCGTGQQSIETAQLFRDAHLLAVDLSMASLAYAKRKTRELGITSIECAQADLAKLGSLGRCFDIIESVGVLHCLADPSAGWRTLVSLLRPGGFMKLGFYSELARQTIVKAMAFIARQGYKGTPDDIRRFRQDMMNMDASAGFASLLETRDFFSISECRDMWFHVQEHRTTLPAIEKFLADNHLLFLGFEIDPRILHIYRRRFPDDRTATNLGLWQIFENENPDTFVGMYQFWVQKRG